MTNPQEFPDWMKGEDAVIFWSFQLSFKGSQQSNWALDLFFLLSHTLSTEIVGRGGGECLFLPWQKVGKVFITPSHVSLKLTIQLLVFSSQFVRKR